MEGEGEGDDEEAADEGASSSENGSENNEGVNESAEAGNEGAEGGEGEEPSPCGADTGSDCGVGACTGGIWICVEGTQELACSTAEKETVELCNERDDDCDGQIDEAFEELGSECGVGECLGGQQICNPGNHEEAICSTRGVATDDDVCDGLDNDCDMLTDEDFVGRGCLEFIEEGGCSFSGLTICDPDSGEICDRPDGFACEWDVATCTDGRDNDSNGVQDCAEDLCLQLIECEWIGDEDEPCNGEDDDNDGFIDDHAECFRFQSCFAGVCVGDLPDDELEPNHAADPFDLGAGLYENLTVSPGNHDWYTLPSCPDGEVAVEIYFLHERVDLNMDAINSDREVVGSGTSSTDDEQFEYFGDEGRATLVVYPVDGSVRGDSCILRIRLSDCEAQDPDCDECEAHRRGGGSACVAGECEVGDQCSTCVADADCISGVSCVMPAGQDEGVCQRPCSFGCPQTSYCSGEICVPNEPERVCQDAELRRQDGCGAVTDFINRCEGPRECVGRGCPGPGMQCSACTEDEPDCAEGHGCVLIGGPVAGVTGLCGVIDCAVGTCPERGPPSFCVDGGGTMICSPTGVGGCHLGDLWQFACDLPFLLVEECQGACIGNRCEI